MRGWVGTLLFVFVSCATSTRSGAQVPDVPDTYRERFKPRDSIDRSSVGRSVAAGLKWLAEHQDLDGRWDCDGFMKNDAAGDPTDDVGLPIHDIGVTGLALLGFLGDGNTMVAGEYRDEVRRAVGWLSDQQRSEGLLGTDNSSNYIYDHAIATYALCEAYGLYQDSELKPVAQAAIDYLEAHRNPGGVWRYQPRDGDHDLSVTGWCTMAYKVAQDFGLAVEPEAWTSIESFLDRVTDSESGRAGYQQAGQPSSRWPGDHAARFPPENGEAMTAVGLSCRIVLAQDVADTPLMPRAADLITAKLPLWNEDSIDYYYWYFASQAMYQMGGRHWAQWRSAIHSVLTSEQRTDENFRGSWDAASVWGENGGRVYSTSMAVMTLQAEYRYGKFNK